MLSKLSLPLTPKKKIESHLDGVKVLLVFRGHCCRRTNGNIVRNQIFDRNCQDHTYAYPAVAKNHPKYTRVDAQLTYYLLTIYTKKKKKKPNKQGKPESSETHCQAHAMHASPLFDAALVSATVSDIVFFNALQVVKMSSQVSCNKSCNMITPPGTALSHKNTT